MVRITYNIYSTSAHFWKYKSRVYYIQLSIRSFIFTL